MRRQVNLRIAVLFLFAAFFGLLLGIILTLFYLEQRIGELQDGQARIMLSMEHEIRWQKYEIRNHEGRISYMERE